MDPRRSKFWAIIKDDKDALREPRFVRFIRTKDILIENLFYENKQIESGKQLIKNLEGREVNIARDISALFSFSLFDFPFSSS